MTPERWREVTAIFHAALARDAGERDAFISERCGIDADLRREVGAMLAGHAEADDSVRRRCSTPRASSTISPPLPKIPRTRSHRSPLTMGDPSRPASSWPSDIASCVSSDAAAWVPSTKPATRSSTRSSPSRFVHPHRAPVDALAALATRGVARPQDSHTGVCRVHDVAIHRQDDRTWLLLTMERVNGESLRERVRRSDISLDEALSIAGQVASALDAAHAQGVLHRDVKPDNILLEPREAGGVRAVLTDFGIRAT